MQPSLRLFCMLLISVITGLGVASCTSSSQSNPGYKFNEGDVSKYTYQTNQKGKVTVDGDTQNFNLQMTNTISQKTQKVDDQGTATVAASYEDSKLTVDGEDLPLQDFLSTLVTYEINSDGVITNVRGTNGLAGPLGERQFDPSQIFQFQGPIFQPGMLNKGDKWQQTVTIPLQGDQQVQGTISYTYEGKESVKGKDAAKVSFVFDAPLDVSYTDLDTPVTVAGQQQMQGTAFFGLNEGKTLKASGKGPLSLSLKTPSEGGGSDIERIKVDIDVDFNYELMN